MSNYFENGTDLDSIYVRRDAYSGNLRKSGLYAAGLNANGELGLGSTGTPVGMAKVVGYDGLTNLSISPDFAMFSDGGGLYFSGINDRGEFGDSTITNRVTFTSDAPLWLATYDVLQSVSTGNGFTAAIVGNTLWTWGAGSDGRLGSGSVANRSSLVQVGTLTNWKTVSCGTSHAISIKTDGTMWAWGGNAEGALGTGNVTSRSSPVQIGSSTNWILGYGCGAPAEFADGIGRSLSFAIKNNGTLWSWGWNGQGQLGLGDTQSRSSPTQVGVYGGWASVSCRMKTTMAIKDDGSLWGWGWNGQGQLGLGDTLPRSTPIQIGSLTDWAMVSAGGGHVIAIKKDGTLWGWGDNQYGQLGATGFSSVSSPVQIGTASNWVDIKAGFVNSFFYCSK